MLLDIRVARRVAFQCRPAGFRLTELAGQCGLYAAWTMSPLSQAAIVSPRAFTLRRGCWGCRRSTTPRSSVSQPGLDGHVACSLMNDAAIARVGDQFGSRGAAGMCQDLRTVVLNGPHAEVELTSDLHAGVPNRDQL